MSAGEYTPPPGCPRDRDGGIGPRVCPLRGCPLHVLRDVGARRQRASVVRLRVLAELGNECVADVVEQHPEGMTAELVALYTGISKQGVDYLTKGSLRKLRRGHALFRHGR